MFAQNQGIDNLWYMGYDNSAGLPWGGFNIDFISSSPVINYIGYRPLDLSRAHANISDSSGNMLFYTNGYDIADATDTIMLNGDNISPSGIRINEPNGLPVPQACLIIPEPNSNHLFYLFHSVPDYAPFYSRTLHLYYSEIDMSLNNGKGAVTSNKNVVLISDTINMGKITACKHGNGRDWWIVCMQTNTDLIYKFLVTPNGINGPYTQNIGINRINGFGQVKFSPDGKKFAYLFANYTTTGNLEVFDFDRCTGQFTNPIHLIIPQSNGYGGGVEFSSNSNLLYVCNIDSVYQYDITNPNLASTKIVVAAWDGFYSPQPPFATVFDNAELASNGKIYITTGNGTFHIHVINNPDSLGLACGLVQHAIQLPAYYFNTLPNHPNYFLGADSASICDSIHVGIAEHPPNKESIKVLSNPNDGHFTLWFNVHDKQGLLQVYDVNGNLIFKDEVAQWSQYKQVDITKHAPGIYFCKMQWGEKVASVKVIKE